MEGKGLKHLGFS